MKEFKKPDVKAPRFRPDMHSVLNKEFFKLFKEKYPKYKSMDDKVLRDIVKKFNTAVYQTVIDKRDGVQLPETIGWIFIGTCQQSKKKNIDFAKSVKYGMTVSNNNWDTDGKLAKIFFTSHAPKHKMRNREFWSFIAGRDFKRSVAKTYPDNWNMYVAVDATAKLRRTYQKAMAREAAINIQDRALKNYNEFEL